MKRLIRNNLKPIVAFFVGIIISSGTIYAVSFDSGDVEHTKSNGTKTTVEAALNDLSTIYTTQPTVATGNAFSSTGGYLSGNSALTTQTSLPLANYKSNNQYTFKIGSGEQVTFPFGYYKYPINISSNIQEFNYQSSSMVANGSTNTTINVTQGEKYMVIRSTFHVNNKTAFGRVDYENIDGLNVTYHRAFSNIFTNQYRATNSNRDDDLLNGIIDVAIGIATSSTLSFPPANTRYATTYGVAVYKIG